MSRTKGAEASRPSKKIAQQSQKNTHGELFSLLGGVIFFSVVFGIAVSRNERVKTELDTQIKNFLNTTKRALAQYQQIVNRISNITDDFKNVAEKDNNTDKDSQSKLLVATNEYDLLWEPVEKAL